MGMAFQLFQSITPYFFGKYSSTFTNKNQILDPVTTSIKLALLYYKPLYTKVSIDKNRVYLQEPKVYQGFVRWAYSDEAKDIHVLMSAIDNFLNWYNISDKRVRYICHRVICGLEKIMKCYEENEDKIVVIKNIQFNIDKIKRTTGELYELDEKDDDDSVTSSDSVLSTISLDDGKDTIYYDFFKNHWNDRELMIVYNMLKELETDCNEKKQSSIIRSIENMLRYKDSETHKFVNKLVKY